MKPTGYFTHTLFRRHEMGEGHPECPQRLDAIEDRLLITGLDHALERREPTPAALSDVELAHDRMHVAALRGLSWTEPLPPAREVVACERVGGAQLRRRTVEDDGAATLARTGALAVGAGQKS